MDIDEHIKNIRRKNGLTQKELAQKTYSLLCNNLSLSSEYKIKEEGDNNA